MSELWELVEGHNLEVGDVIKVGCEYPPQVVEIIDDNGWIPMPGLSIAPHDTVFRRIPDDEDPRVLRRALEMATRFISTVDEDYDTKPTPWIEQARKEQESEVQRDQA